MGVLVIRALLFSSLRLLIFGNSRMKNSRDHSYSELIVGRFTLRTQIRLETAIVLVISGCELHLKPHGLLLLAVLKGPQSHFRCC